MKFKLVVLDLELSTRAKRLAAAVAVPLVILGGGAVAYANAPHVWKDGDTLTAADLNANFSKLQSQIHSPSGFRASRSTAFPLEHGVPAPIIFDSADFDLAKEYSVSTGIFTPKEKGIYLVNCGVAVTTTAAAVVTAGIMKNGKDIGATDLTTPSPGANVRPEVNVLLQLEAGDKIQCAGYQSSGVALSALSGPRTWFGAVRVQ